MIRHHLDGVAKIDFDEAFAAIKAGLRRVWTEETHGLAMGGRFFLAIPSRLPFANQMSYYRVPDIRPLLNLMDNGQAHVVFWASTLVTQSTELPRLGGVSGLLRDPVEIELSPCPMAPDLSHRSLEPCVRESGWARAWNTAEWLSWSTVIRHLWNPRWTSCRSAWRRWPDEGVMCSTVLSTKQHSPKPGTLNRRQYPYHAVRDTVY
jgi:hypothetical protein